MRQVDEIHNAENERKTGGHQKQQDAELRASWMVLWLDRREYLERYSD